MMIKSTRNAIFAALVFFISATFQTVFASGVTSSSLDKASAVSTTEAVSKISLNTATADELTIIKGVGPKTADAIIAYREKNGDFSNLEDLTNIKGIGPGTLTKIMPYLSL